MDTQDIVETWRREAIEEGVVQGRREGREEGIKQGVAQGREEGIKHSLVALYKARFGAMPEELCAVVEDTDDEPTLLTWLLLTGTGTADEIAAAIRSSRPS
jgi:flagellar biosynthesis/type III secretory pathway protein FliH